MTAKQHIFTNSLSAHIHKFITCRLHNSLFISVAKRKLHEHCQTAIQSVAKFHVLPGELSFVPTNFLQLHETWKKNCPLFKQIIARYAEIFTQTFKCTFIEKSQDQRTKFMHFACITFAQYCSLLFNKAISLLFLAGKRK